MVAAETEYLESEIRFIEITKRRNYLVYPEAYRF